MSTIKALNRKPKGPLIRLVLTEAHMHVVEPLLNGGHCPTLRVREA